MKDHIKNKYDAILMIGGWNNTIEVSYIPYIVYKAMKKETQHIDVFKKIFINIFKDFEYWSIDEYRKQWLIKSGTIQILNIH